MDPSFFIASGDLEDSVNRLSLTVVTVASILLILLVVRALKVVKHKKKHLKTPVFIAILVVVVGTTLTISGSTVYLNIASATGGPVHWHADIEFWACGNELELRNPTGLLSNKIGTATLHEHNDKRIHLEGVPVSLPEDASLGKFMHVIGGEVTNDSLTIPLNDDKLFETDKGEEDGDGSGAPSPELINPYLHTTKEGKIATFTSQDKCGDQPAAPQVFVYNFDKETKTYTQTRLTDPANYAITGAGEVPPGDCIIFEFDAPKGRTDKLCRQYGIRDKIKCERFGVTPRERKICENMEAR